MFVLVCRLSIDTNVDVDDDDDGGGGGGGGGGIRESNRIDSNRTISDIHTHTQASQPVDELGLCWLLLSFSDGRMQNYPNPNRPAHTNTKRASELCVSFAWRWM